MLPAKKSPVSVSLGDEHMLPEAPRCGHAIPEPTDYKLDAAKHRIVTAVCEKYSQYPSFKTNILSNDHLLKICNELEKRVHVAGVDKREMVITVVETIIKRTLTREEVSAAAAAIQFMHNAKLIHAPLLVKLYHRVRAMFRV